MNLRKKLFILFLIILFTVLQSTVLNYVQILQTKPDILLILVIYFSLNYGQIYGLIIGALCGFFAEVTSHLPLGILVLVYAFGAVVLGNVRRWFYTDEVLPWQQKIGPASLSRFSHQILPNEFWITFIFGLIIYFSIFFILPTFKVNLSLLNTFIFVILPASFYTACVSPFLFRFLNLILNIK